MNFCNQCGAALTVVVPEDDNRPRHVCTACATVHYVNPRIVAGCIPEWHDQILLCRRAIEPRRGLWTLPAGFMEVGETTWQAALRETLEEANARVRIGDLYAVVNLPHVDQVYMMFRSRLLDRDFHPGAESEEVRLFEPADLPWRELAFPVIRYTLEFLLEDRRAGSARLRYGDVVRGPDGFAFREAAPPARP